MKAIGIKRYLPISDEASLLDLEVPKPEVGGRDLLVAVRAIAVNPVDAKVRAPKSVVEDPPRILGWDAAGVVHLVDERIVGRKPSSRSYAEAAALPLTSITAWERRT